MKRYKDGTIMAGLILIIAIIGIIVYFVNNPIKLKSSPTTTPSSTVAPAESKGNSCSIFADKCIVDEWEPICLLVDCVIDARGGE